jgi:hypothetical protein
MFCSLATPKRVQEAFPQTLGGRSAWIRAYVG